MGGAKGPPWDEVTHIPHQLCTPHGHAGPFRHICVAVTHRTACRHHTIIPATASCTHTAHTAGRPTGHGS